MTTKVDPKAVDMKEKTMRFSCPNKECRHNKKLLVLKNIKKRSFSFPCPGCKTRHNIVIERRKINWEERKPPAEEKARVVRCKLKLSCRLVNITNGGACIEASYSIRDPLKIGSVLRLEYILLDQLRQDDFHVRWIKDNLVGLQYVDGDRTPLMRVQSDINWREK